VSDLKRADVAIEASWQRQLLRYYLKLSPWILLVAMLAVGVVVATHGQNPYVTFALLGGIYALLEAGRWLPALLGTPPTGSTFRISARFLVDLAALLAGRKRQALRAEWRAHLAGESGHDPATWRKIRQALGFLASAIRFRLADAAELAWRPTDAVLGSRTLSNLFVWGPLTVTLVAIVHHDGRFGLVADIQDPAALGAFLYGVIRTGRWWRGVKPPEPKPKRARK
jgi:hypothetical protein